MGKLSVAKHLSDQEYQMFLKVYSNHNRSMGLKYREKYSLGNVVKVERNLINNCLTVKFSNGDWWHYHKDGTWS